jgi:hypothetical protein
VKYVIEVERYTREGMTIASIEFPGRSPFLNESDALANTKYQKLMAAVCKDHHGRVLSWDRPIELRRIDRYGQSVVIRSSPTSAALRILVQRVGRKS